MIFKTPPGRLAASVLSLVVIVELVAVSRVCFANQVSPSASQLAEKSRKNGNEKSSSEAKLTRWDDDADDDDGHVGLAPRTRNWNRDAPHKDEDAPTRDNELGVDQPPAKSGGGGGGPYAHKSQLDYVCGRAVANKKYKDILLRDTGYQMSVARAKYRPIEIRMPRIIGGDDTSPGEFPWAVSIKLNGQPICGGSLIDRDWILTAAHCVVGYNPKNLTVRLGAYRIKDTSESQTIDLPVSMFVVHKDYSMPRPFSNDIAMLKLVESVEYTDYIIPICLPTEDQLTTSTATLAVNDYSNRLESASKSAGLGEDIGGIVISTKMSDHEIAKCFNRLEQNYLSSIGLGAVAEAATEQAPPPPPPLAAQASSPAGQLVAASESSSSSNRPQHQQQHQHQKNGGSKLLFLQPTTKRPPLAAGQQHQQHQPPVEHLTFDLSQFTNPLDVYDDSYYGSPWISRDLAAAPAAPAAKASALNKMTAGGNSRSRELVKLSRLPISKELLREIQSLGSAQMPSLDLSSQSGADFVAMASDLAAPEQLVHTSAGLQQQQQQLSSSMPAATTTAADIGGSSSSSNGANNRGRFGSSPHSSSIVRTIASDNDNNSANTIDDPTKYSGLSGTVVGWGWVRELDGEDQVNNKGYPSVTLQKVKLPILRNHVCEAWFQSQSKKITLLPSQFCAGFNSGGKDACRGDSGGPMIIEDSSDTGRYKLIGIVSAGIGCARPSLPGLYTRVASFLPWINAQMNRY